MNISFLFEGAIKISGKINSVQGFGASAPDSTSNAFAELQNLYAEKSEAEKLIVINVEHLYMGVLQYTCVVTYIDQNTLLSTKVFNASEYLEKNY